MGTVSKIILASFGLLAVYIGIQIHNIIGIPSVPQLKNEWWGPGQPREQSKTISSFKIKIPDTVLEDLNHRLNNSRSFTPALEGVQQQYGFNTKTLKEIVDYWQNKYNWREREKFLNQFPQFQTNIQGLNLHYIHVKPNVPPQTPVYPILILHGWPGSVREFYKIIPLLTKSHEKYEFAFEVIAPSLPGFAFSEGTAKPGLGAAEIAVVMKNLMERIGHEKFYVQGGDWGSIIIKNMATFYPDQVLGLHTNFAFSSGPWSSLKLMIGGIFPSLFMPSEYVDRVYPLLDKFQWLLEESGYFHLQATKPDTVGVGLNDSPAGLAAYILEKFSSGTKVTYKQREDAGLLEKYTYDELIDNLMLYWVTKSATTSVRIYAETMNKKQYSLGLENLPVDLKIPCAVARFPYEILYYPEWILRDLYPNLIQVTDFKEGGHFAALEVPKLLAEDIFSAVAKMKESLRIH